MKGTLVCCACVVAGTARADSVAISVTGPINPPGGAQPFNYTQGSYIAGFAFKVKTPISITQLGFYDSNLAGVAETFNSAPVGVYDLSTNTLLVSATVLTSDPATGFFRYVPITPLALNITDVYAVVGVTGANYYTVGIPASSSPVNAAISYLSPAYYSSATSTLQQPNDFSGGNIFGTPTPPTVLNDFGANFQFTAPGTSPGGPTITLVANAEGEAPTIAPNTWVEIKGSNLAPAGDTRIWLASDFVNNQMPTQLDHVSVTVNGKPAYVYYISPTQVNILTPPDAISGLVQVQLTNNGANAASAVQAQPISPSFFNINGGSYVLAVHADYSVIGPASLAPGVTTPAKPGETIVLYGNGFGPSTTPVVSGSTTQGGTLSPLPVIQIGGLGALVQYAGLVMPGVFQINVTVPPATPDGNNTITATYNGLTTSSNVLLAVQQ